MYITPIQMLNGQLNNNKIFIKRDDLLPISFGGNKARKAILFFEELEEKYRDCVITYGSSSSNHCRIIANIAAQKGLPCYIISPTEINKNTFNSQMMTLFGAEIIFCPVKDVGATINKKINELQSLGKKPYFIEGGGHGNLGTQAYVNAYEEIKNFEKENGIYFEYIIHTSGTGTTQAGLVCGQVMNGDLRQIIGLSNARMNPRGKEIVLDSINSYLETVDIEPISIETVNFIDEYVLGGYGNYNKDIIQTIKKILIQEGIPLDTTYTGKAFWGMEKYIKKNNITGKNILFIHTGGTPLFFNDLEELTNE